GVLHVAERLAFVFTGDWNGGERTFRLEPDQHLKLIGVSPLDARSGQMRPLPEGDPSDGGRYRVPDPRPPRSRSRLPSDPPFDKTEILYELDYEVSGILLREGDRYILNHDFAFPDRAGSIEAFSLELALDPVWKPDRPVPPKIEQGLLPSGQSVVV